MRKLTAASTVPMITIIRARVVCRKRLSEVFTGAVVKRVMDHSSNNPKPAELATIVALSRAAEYSAANSLSEPVLSVGQCWGLLRSENLGRFAVAFATTIYHSRDELYRKFDESMVEVLPVTCYGISIFLDGDDMSCDVVDITRHDQ